MPDTENQKKEKSAEEKKAVKKASSTKSSSKTKKAAEKKLKPHRLCKTIKLDNLYYSFHQQELEDILQAINKEVGSAAITLTANEYTELKIDIDMDKFNSITKRRAGRKKKKTNVLYEQIVEYSKTHTSMETAEWLGLTRQTYYRKLKAHREANDDGSVEF